ncbi:hypothetical protein [Persephonella sp. KM09-Lau-8]|uniref:hypothetical protein n=1 Tax=Persephonella sp. KM09-Lau-8 TaxID=1158345 RepID=UPI000498189C|nr:hypothetical protein [Persephonella sp. KM09-Lau-8]
MRSEAFVLSDFQENMESGFYVWNPDFDLTERELLDEEAQLAEKLAEFGIDWDVSQEELPAEELNKRNKKRLLTDSFCQENIEGVFIKEDSILVKFINPGYGVRWARFSTEEVQDLPLDLQKQFLSNNPYIFPYVDTYLVNIEEVKFFKSNKGIIYVKIGFNGNEVVYDVEKNKELLCLIKEKFDLREEVKEAWKAYRDMLSKTAEVKRAVAKAQRVYKKESGTSDWYQYSIKFSENVIYIFKPRSGKNGGVYYSIFKVLKGNPAMGIPDKVEPLFAVSTDKFLREWEPLLERR